MTSEPSTQSGFMEAHRSFGNVVTDPYRNRVNVAASAYGGQGRVSVRGETPEGQHIGGLLTIERARLLVTQLEEAIEYAEFVASEQRAASIPDLERQLAEAREAEASRGPSGTQ